MGYLKHWSANLQENVVICVEEVVYASFISNSAANII